MEERVEISVEARNYIRADESDFERSFRKQFNLQSLVLSKASQNLKMHFAPLLSVMGLAASASAAVGASQMTSNIDAITQLSSETNDIAKEISVTNFFNKAPVRTPWRNYMK